MHFYGQLGSISTTGCSNKTQQWMEQLAFKISFLADKIENSGGRFAICV